MAEAKPNILYVGDNGIHFELMRDLMSSENQFSMNTIVRNVCTAVDKINSGRYWGALAGGLVFPTGKHPEQHPGMARYEKYDGSPFIFRSSGLYIVECACKKGLVTVVNRVAESNEVLEEAERLGAIIVPKTRGSSSQGILGCFKTVCVREG